MLGDQRQHKREFDDEVAVAGDIEAVGRDAVESQSPGHVVTVDRQRRAGQRRGAEAALVRPPTTVAQPVAVPLKFFAVGQPEVRGQAPAGPAADACRPAK